MNDSNKSIKVRVFSRVLFSAVQPVLMAGYLISPIGPTTLCSFVQTLH